MIAAAVLTFAACSNNELINEINVQNEAEPQIGFAQNAIDKTTRAELTMDWFHTLNNGFGVYGYKNDDNIFKNENVYLASKNESLTAPVTSVYRWDHATIRFWDKAALDAYDFYAYAPFTGTNNVAGTNPAFDKDDGFTFTQIKTIEDITTAGADKAVANAVEDIDYTDGRLHSDHSNSPTVQFTFNHILSKLSFKIKTDVPAWNAATNPTATFTVTDIKIDFPTDNNVTWQQGGSNVIAGTTSYSSGYAAKTGTKADAAFETVVFPTGSQEVTSSATAIGKTFIVTPVNSTVKKHEFDVQVTYNVKYADGTTETGCKATGTVGTGNPALSSGDPGYDPNIYAPGQNEYYVAVINLNPAAIEFCVESVAAWDPNGTDLEEVDVK